MDSGYNIVDILLVIAYQSEYSRKQAFSETHTSLDHIPCREEANKAISSGYEDP